MTYDLHLVVNENLLNDLKNISLMLNKKSISSAIVVIFEALLPNMEKYQIKFHDKKSEYKLIADLKEKRHHIHAYLPEKTYRKLKELHQYLNFYSIAQIIREIIKIYMKEYAKYGYNYAIRKIERIRSHWNKWKEMRKGKEILRQLYLLESLTSTFSVTYDKNYLPCSIKFF